MEGHLADVGFALKAMWQIKVLCGRLCDLHRADMEGHMASAGWVWKAICFISARYGSLYGLHKVVRKAA